MTGREQAVLDALLSVEFDGVEQLRSAAQHVLVIGGCECGCPSIDFHKDPGTGIHIRVNARVDGTSGGLFLYTVGDRLGGIEWLGTSEEGDPDEFPDPAVLVVSAV
jgi:hypothetical protein